jgi:hypothetical protein
MATVRMFLRLSEEDRRWLEGYSRANKVPMAEVIRRAVKNLRQAQAGSTYQDLLQCTGGTWKQGDGLEYQRRIRSEWGER